MKTIERNEVRWRRRRGEGLPDAKRGRPVRVLSQAEKDGHENNVLRKLYARALRRLAIA
jgi:hypothetical protein